MNSSRHSDDSGPSNHQKLPSIAEIIQADLHRARRSLTTPPESSSPGPLHVKAGDIPLPQPIRPQSNLPYPFPGSSTGILHPRPGTLTSRPAAQARHQPVLCRYPDNQTYKETLGQIMLLSHTIYNFAQSHQRMALKQQGIHVNPARLPQEQEVSDMLRYLERVKQLLQQVGPPQTSLWTQPGLHPPQQQHMIGMPNRMTTPMNASTGVPKPDLPWALSTRCGNCSRLIARPSRQRSYRGQALCRDCNYYQTRQEAKRSSRRDRPL